MRSTLFYIPHELAGLKVFGAGWGLIALAICFVGWASWVLFQGRARTKSAQTTGKPLADILSGLPLWVAAVVLILFVLPSIEQTVPGNPPVTLGLPIRGYGVMVLIGMLGGIAITTHRGKQLGVSQDMIVSLGFWMMAGGVVGARIFYVVQKWNSDFAQYAPGERIVAIFKLTEGGLVIYGGVIGGLIAGALFCRRHAQPMRAMADLIAPGFLLGLAFGRIGCLLNGCCFGGVCTTDLPTIQFPQGSSPYMVQLETGKLLGIEVARRSEGLPLPAEIVTVAAGSPAERAGIKAGDILKGIRPYLLPITEGDIAAAPKVIADIAYNDNLLTLTSNQLPADSLPVQPAQIYAAINAALLCGLVWLLQPIPARDGIVFLTAVALKGSSRFLLEGIRSDEAGQLGTALTVSQWISLIGLGIALALILAIWKTPAGRAWQWRSVPA